MSEFQIGDMIGHLLFENQTFMITDFEDFSKNRDGSDILYEVMDIFPITKNSKIRFFDSKFMEVKARKGNVNYDVSLKYLYQEREKLGFVGEPEYIKVINQNELMAKEKDKIKEPTDIIEYNKIETVDECLDAMNDLTRLHEMFGDDTYLKLRKTTVRRLKKLTKKV
jgi:hypothetical protein